MHKILVFIKNYWVMGILALAFLFCNSCSHQNQPSTKKQVLTNEERKSLEKFFRYFMLHESAIFTLLGSKPLTEVVVSYDKKKQEEFTSAELERFIYFQINQDDPAQMAFYKKLPSVCKTKAILIRDCDFIYNIDELWDFWEQIASKFSISKKFLLIKKERSVEDLQLFGSSYEKIYDIFLIDIFKTSLILQENYDLFKQAVGFDFDPVQTVFELQNPNSLFWDTIKTSKHSYLWGLLYGFGKQNSFGYYWKYRYLQNNTVSEREKEFSESIKKWSSGWWVIQNYVISEFPIPAFASYSDSDPIVLQYEKERAQIQKLYKGKDFVDYTLELLTEN